MKDWYFDPATNIFIHRGTPEIVTYEDYEKYKGKFTEPSDELLDAIHELVAFFREAGKRGGETTKKKTDYSALGKKGAEKRWKKS